MDPFSGLGSTAVACARLGVDFVGADIDETYLDEAVARCGRRRTSREMTQRGSPRMRKASLRARAEKIQVVATLKPVYFLVADTGFGGGLSTYSFRATTVSSAPFCVDLHVDLAAALASDRDSSSSSRARSSRSSRRRSASAPCRSRSGSRRRCRRSPRRARAGCPATCGRSRSTASDRPARRCRPSRPARAGRSCRSSTFARLAARVSSASSRARSASANSSLCFCCCVSGSGRRSNCPLCWFI